MKIIVNNKEEKKLVLKFIEVIRDFGFDAIGAWEGDFLKDNPEIGPSFCSHEEMILTDALGWASVEIDPSVSEMFFEDDELVTGTCCKCGAQTEGTEDRETSYVDYLEYMSEDRQKTWLCSDCFNKGYAEELESV